jgi:phosphoribosylaminoimidazolecarboxamide formyltransferase / IMP cyclohydrolase
MNDSDSNSNSKNAIISVSNKENINSISKFLLDNEFTIYSTGGTFIKLLNDFPQFEDKIKPVSDYTKFPEILGGRVKTLHPKIYGGILADSKNQEHLDEIKNHNIHPFSVVIVNLYPFEDKNCIENIDIGGVTLIRASAKNYNSVSILTNPTQYRCYLENYPEISESIRREWARDAFNHTRDYDNNIFNFFNDSTPQQLKYGMNPHQQPATVVSNNAFDILNGSLGYINVLDFIHGWLMTYEIYKKTNKITFISMKHTSPAGLGIGTNISDTSLDIFGISENIRNNLSECAIAFIKSRNCDPLSSFGDFICCSSKVDVTTANLIKREVCDGIAAPEFEPEALKILSEKKNGKFIILKADTDYFEKMLISGWHETKSIYGITLSQPSNDFVFDPLKLRLEIDDYDAIIAYIILKYSQSNNISMVYNGQLLGLGCGQQNRVGCVKLAGEKALVWRLRHHPEVISYYKMLHVDNPNLKRQERVNLVYEYIETNKNKLVKSLREIPITLGSDGFFPFPDNIVAAKSFGVKRIIQPGGSIADSSVKNKCDELNIEMINVGARMFYH